MSDPIKVVDHAAQNAAVSLFLDWFKTMQEDGLEHEFIWSFLFQYGNFEPHEAVDQAWDAALEWCK